MTDPREVLERMAAACIDPDYETWENLAPVTKKTLYDVIQAALRELVETHKKRTHSLKRSDVQGRLLLAQTVLAITELEL